MLLKCGIFHSFHQALGWKVIKIIIITPANRLEPSINESLTPELKEVNIDLETLSTDNWINKIVISVGERINS